MVGNLKFDNVHTELAMPKVHTNDKGEICGSVWSKEDKDYLRKNYSCETVGDIAKALNRTYEAIIRKAKQMNITQVYITKQKIMKVVYNGNIVKRKIINGDADFVKAVKDCYFHANPALRRGEKITIELEYE